MIIGLLKTFTERIIFNEYEKKAFYNSTEFEIGKTQFSFFGIYSALFLSQLFLFFNIAPILMPF